MSLSEYIDETSKKNTQNYRKRATAKFLEYVFDITREGKRTDADYLALDTLSVQYLTEPRTYDTDLRRYIGFMKGNQVAPITIRSSFSIIITWFAWNNIVIEPNKMKLLKNKLPKGWPITKKERNISPEMIQNICSHTPLHLTALIQVLMSSGMRIDEALSITPDNIDFTATPVTISLSREITKTDTDRYTFISAEADRTLRLWLAAKPDWFRQVVKFGANLGKEKDLNDPRVFPFHNANLSRSLKVYLKRAGYFEVDERTGRRTISPHLFRGYFLSQLQAAGMTKGIAEKLAGHAPPYHGAYEIYSDDQIREAYLSAEYAVSVYSSVDMKEMKEAKDQAAYALSQQFRQEIRIKSIEEDYAEIKQEFDEYRKGLGVIKLAKLYKPQDVISKEMDDMPDKRPNKE